MHFILHDWKETGKEHTSLDLEDTYWDEEGCHFYQEHTTVVTFRCDKCGKYKQQILEGHIGRNS